MTSLSILQISLLFKFPKSSISATTKSRGSKIWGSFLYVLHIHNVNSKNAHRIYPSVQILELLLVGGHCWNDCQSTHDNVSQNRETKPEACGLLCKWS